MKGRAFIRCAACGAWDPAEDAARASGYCRLLAPQPRLAGADNAQSLGDHVIWPITFADDGCTEGAGA